MSRYQLTFGQCYHLYQQGNNRQSLFRDDGDYDYFLDLYRKYLQPITELYSYCLMPTHIHLLFRIKEKTEIEYVYPREDVLGGQIELLLSVYTRTRIKSVRETPELFDGGDVRMIPEKKLLLCKLTAYIHQNPQIHGVVSDYRYWPHSSSFAYLRQDRRSMISKKTLLDPEFRMRLISLQNGSGLPDFVWDCD